MFLNRKVSLRVNPGPGAKCTTAIKFHSGKWVRIDLYNKYIWSSKRLFEIKFTDETGETKQFRETSASWLTGCAGYWSGRCSDLPCPVPRAGADNKGYFFFFVLAALTLFLLAGLVLPVVPLLIFPRFVRLSPLPIISSLNFVVIIFRKRMFSSGYTFRNRITIISPMTKEIYLTHRWFLVVIVLAFLSGCASLTTVESLRAGLDSDGVRPVVIDVRTKGEFESGHIPGAVNISVFRLPFNTDRVPVSGREQRVVLYCAHGPRAGLAGFFLRLSGFTEVYHLKGDFNGWRKGGYPIQKVAGEN